MKKVNIIMVMILIFIACFGSGCNKNNENVPFGMFSYNGKHLTAYATKEISAEEAKTITQEQSRPIIGFSTNVKKEKPIDLFSVNPSSPINTPLPSTALVDSVITEYASVEVHTKYYVTGIEEPQTKTDFLQGTDFKNIIEINQFTPFSQLVAKGVIIFDELIDYMEEQNEIFANSDDVKIAPFKTIFSYHTDKSGNIVIQTRDFSEIPSSVGGGIGCSYRQDTEIVYDKENKLSKWQTSLGVYSATPKGTLMQGYILEVELIWNKKV